PIRPGRTSGRWGRRKGMTLTDGTSRDSRHSGPGPNLGACRRRGRAWRRNGQIMESLFLIEDAFSPTEVAGESAWGVTVGDLRRVGARVARQCAEQSLYFHFS